MSTMLRDPEELQRMVGWDRDLTIQPEERARLRSYIDFQLAAAGLSAPKHVDTTGQFNAGIFESLKQKNRLLAEHRAPIDSRIESFLNTYFSSEVGDAPLRLPSQSLTLDRHGMARELSLPADGDQYETDIVRSYRCHNGILNNPKADRRTTAGTFHVVQG
ncbi:MAG: hypothetical protein AAF664_17935, partial [Planctomycetota bacterium]